MRFPSIRVVTREQAEDYFIAPWERKGAVGQETQTKGIAE
jgi:hypothetical protein